MENLRNASNNGNLSFAASAACRRRSPFAGHDPAQGGGDLGATGEHRLVGCGHCDHDATPTVGMIQGMRYCWTATSTPSSRVSTMLCTKVRANTTPS